MVADTWLIKPIDFNDNYRNGIYCITKYNHKEENLIIGVTLNTLTKISNTYPKVLTL